jgi:hypothetical protein
MLVERYGKQYPTLAGFVQYLEEARGWWDQSILQSLGGQIRNNLPTLVEFGLAEFPVYALFSRWEFGSQELAVRTLTFELIPTGGSLYPLIDLMRIDYLSGHSASQWKAEKAENGAAVFTVCV